MSGRKVLNVGGFSHDNPFPAIYEGWTHHLLDIDPQGRPDIVADARWLKRTLPAGSYDAVFCSHNLEHYFAHEVPQVLAGFFHVLKEDGFAQIFVPDIVEVMKRVVRQNLDLDDVLYQSNAGPVSARDVLWGHSASIVGLQSEHYAHKTGFTRKILGTILREAGFKVIAFSSGELEIRVLAFKRPPTDEQRAWLNVKD